MMLKFLRERRADLTAEAAGRALSEAEKTRDDAIAAAFDETLPLIGCRH